jgi:hypothetical protein
MEIQHEANNIRLTSSEIGQLWLTYVGDTMSKCIISYFDRIVQDSDIHEVVKFHLGEINKHLEMATDIFKSVNFPIPEGFNESDVNLSAKRLYSDVFILNYIKYASGYGLLNQAMALPMVTREDVRKFFNEYIESYKELCNRADSVLLEKGLYMRAPYITIPDRVEFVDNKNYLSGFMQDLFGNERPINTLEISQAFNAIQTNALGKALLMGFMQVTDNKNLQNFFQRGKEISEKHIEVFSSMLKKADVPVPMLWDSEVIASTAPPFSDKLMMFHVTALITYGAGRYGLSLASSMRSDIASTYSRLISEIGQYSKDGAVMSINNGWLEKPPAQAKHEDIVRV